MGNIFAKTRGYFILVTAETGLELYDPLNVTDKTITAKIPSRTHTRVMREHNKIKFSKMISAAEFATSVLSVQLFAPNTKIK